MQLIAAVELLSSAKTQPKTCCPSHRQDSEQEARVARNAVHGGSRQAMVCDESHPTPCALGTATLGPDRRVCERSSGRDHLRREPRAQGTISSLDQLPEDGVAAKLEPPIIGVAFARSDPRNADPPIIAKERGLHHPRSGSIQRINVRTLPGAERIARHPVTRHALVAENQVTPAAPGEVVRAFRRPRQTGDDERLNLLPLPQVIGDQVGETASTPGDRSILQRRRDEHVEAPIGGAVKDEGIAEVPGVVPLRRGGERVGRLLLEVNAVHAGCQAQVLRPISHPRRVETVIGAHVVEDRPRADRTLAGVGNRDGERVVLPGDKVSGGRLRPLVAS